MLTRPHISTTEQLLQTAIAPQANQLDHNPKALFEAFQLLGQHHLLGLRISQTWGGAELVDVEFRQFQELFARYSGALALLQAQHQSAGTLLSKSENTALQRSLLPGMVTGKIGVGISFSHLRRADSPLKAIAVSGGYEFSGQVPWVTGWGCFQWFIAAARLPNDQVVYGLIPLESQTQAQGELICREPLALAALSATNTVVVEFYDWFVPETNVVTLRPLSALAKSDRLNVLQHSFYALGCAQAGLDLLSAKQQQRQKEELAHVYAHLLQELSNCRQAIYAAQPELNPFAELLELRARAIALAVRCAHAAVIASGGAANNLEHSAQRIFREAMVFSVTGQTEAVMVASLKQLLL